MRLSRHLFHSSPPGPRDLISCLMALALLIASVSLISCGGTKVLINQSGALVRAGPDVSGHVYTWTGEEWSLSGNKVRIPEGWFIGPLEEEGTP